MLASERRFLNSLGGMWEDETRCKHILRTVVAITPWETHLSPVNVTAVSITVEGHLHYSVTATCSQWSPLQPLENTGAFTYLTQLWPAPVK